MNGRDDKKQRGGVLPGTGTQRPRIPCCSGSLIVKKKLGKKYTTSYTLKDLIRLGNLNLLVAVFDRFLQDMHRFFC